jgi:hypothetical protein
MSPLLVYEPGVAPSKKTITVCLALRLLKYCLQALLRLITEHHLDEEAPLNEP